MASALLYRTAMRDEASRETKACARCGGPAAYRPDAIVPGDPAAPRGSRRAAAHAQPAWECITCGAIEAEERRAARILQRQGT